jgi:hypothetical protein
MKNKMAGGVVDEIFNAAAEQAENCLEIKKDWIANPPAWPDYQGANPMLPNDNNLVHRYRGPCDLVLCR